MTPCAVKPAHPCAAWLAPSLSFRSALLLLGHFIGSGPSVRGVLGSGSAVLDPRSQPSSLLQDPWVWNGKVIELGVSTWAKEKNTDYTHEDRLQFKRRSARQGPSHRRLLLTGII